MFQALLRYFRHRLPSFVFTVAGIAIALSTLLAVFSLRTALVDGKPNGTKFETRPYSVFAHIKNRNMDMFLFPPQIFRLQAILGEHAEVLGSSGSRKVQVEFGGSTSEASADIATPNFFRALGVEIDQGGSADFGSSQYPATAILSERYMARMGLDQAPTTIAVANRQVKVVGVARNFNGLWDRDTELWVDWRLGHDILSPSTLTQGVNGFFWTLIIPAIGRQIEVSQRLKTISKRKDLTQPPFDFLRVVPGITNTGTSRSNVERNLWIYLLLCSTLVLTAMINLATWSAMLRLGKHRNERTLLDLGITRTRHQIWKLLFILVPVFFGLLVTPVLFWAFSSLLQADAAIQSFLAESAGYDTPFPWGVFFAGALAFLLFGWLVGELVSWATGLRYDSTGSHSHPKRLEGVFKPIITLMGTLSVIALIFGMTQLHSTYAAWKGLETVRGPDVNMYFVNQSSASPQLDSAMRENIRRTIRSRFPGVSQLGFLKVRPVSDVADGALSFALKEGELPSIKFMLNGAEADAMALIGATQRRGRIFNPSLSAMEMVIDARTADEIFHLTQNDNVVGRQLFDVAGMAWTIVGVVDNVPYGSDPSTPPLVGYVPLGDSPIVANLITRGTLTRTERRLLSETPLKMADGTIQFGPAANMAEQVNRSLAPYKTRTLFALVNSLMTLIIAALTLLAVTTLEIRRMRKRLAIRASLGEPLGQTLWNAMKGILIALLVGAFLGVLLIAVLGPQLASIGSVATPTLVWALPLSVLSVILVGAASTLLVIRREFSRHHLLQLLRED